MPFYELIAILAAGVLAGAINTVVGSGSLVTFPTLLFFGYPPLVANMTNNVGLLPGNITGAHGYRAELTGQRPLLMQLLPASLIGGIVGAGLLLVLPASVFGAVVPLLILVGVVLVVVGPLIQRRARARADARGGVPSRGLGRRVVLPVLVFLTGIYGGYFGAAQGVILMGVMGVFMSENLQVLNAVKNVLGLVVNTVAGVVFIAVRGDEIHWWAAAVVGVGTLIGGILGARVGRRLPPVALRSVIVVVGLVAIARMTVFA